MSNFTPDELAERRKGIGASEAAAACGLSPWKSRYQLYLEKLGEAPAEDPDAEDALPLLMGHALEPIALQQFARRTKFTISDQQRKIVDPHWPHRWVSVDALSSDGGLVEAKSTGFANPAEWGDELEDGAVPMHYLLQCQHGLACTGLSHAWMPLIISNRQFRLYRIRRDEELIQLLTGHEQNFWKMVTERTSPAPQTLEDVRIAWPSHANKKAEASAEIAEKVNRHKLVKEQLKALDAEKTDLELAIKLAMSDAAELVDASGSALVTWKQAKASRKFDEDRFALDHPTVYAHYQREIPGSRRFLNKL